jgi:hypothetical protein
MPRLCQLKEIDGALWARLDIDYDGGSVSLYTPIEIKQMKDQVIKDVISALRNWDTVIWGDND